MQFEHGTWRAAAQNFWANKWLALVVIGVLAAGTVYQNTSRSPSFLILLLQLAWILLAFAAHATILEAKSGFQCLKYFRPKKLIFPFWGRCIVIAVLISAFFRGTTYDFPGSTYGPIRDFDLIISLCLFYVIINSFLGTMLPACVEGGNFTIHAAAKAL